MREPFFSSGEINWDYFQPTMFLISLTSFLFTFFRQPPSPSSLLFNSVYHFPSFSCHSFSPFTLHRPSSWLSFSHFLSPIALFSHFSSYSVSLLLIPLLFLSFPLILLVSSTFLYSSFPHLSSPFLSSSLRLQVVKLPSFVSPSPCQQSRFFLNLLLSTTASRGDTVMPLMA